MRTIDRRTRLDADVSDVSPDEFFATQFPALVERNGDVAARGLAALATRPLTIAVDGSTHTILAENGTLVARRGAARDAITATVSASQFSDWAQDLLTFNAMWVARELRLEGGTIDDTASWDMIWVALLNGWPVADAAVSFVDRHGAPLDLTTHFTPDDEPHDVAHFLREAGFLHLRGWLDPSDMATIAADIERALPSYRRDDGRSWWATTAKGEDRCVRLQHFVDHSTATRQLLSSATWDRLRRVLAGPDNLVQSPVEANCIEALVKPVGVVQGISDPPWHRDCNFGRHSYQCSGTTVGIAVTPGRHDSGLLRVVAGSHRIAMPAHRANTDPYLPVIALPTEAGDVTVHLSCTLHEALPPTRSERMVMYTNFGLPELDDDARAAGTDLSALRERVHTLQSQPSRSRS
jgi:ectoine hydroxylase-related dioxygenase (phytanoyl-CoA dioxygenase family)